MFRVKGSFVGVSQVLSALTRRHAVKVASAERREMLYGYRRSCGP